MMNFQAFFAHSDVLDVNSVYSNDLNLVLNQYGIEACNRAIVSASQFWIIKITFK